MKDIYELIESGLIQNLDFDNSTMHRINARVNKYTEGEFFYPPVILAENLLSMHFIYPELPSYTEVMQKKLFRK